MYYYPTQDDIAIIKQLAKDVHIKIELLDRTYKILESIQGQLLSDSLSVDSQSQQRRTYNVTLYVTDASFLLGEDKKIWIDKYIRVYYGITSVHTGEVAWYLVGTFTYVDAGYTYSATENRLELSCADMMADYDGTKNGEIDGYSLTIPAGEDMRESILALVKDAGIEKYQIEDPQKEIPYDLEFNDSKTYYDVWKKICELYDSWEFYFDVDGTFIWRKVPTGLSEPVIADDTLFGDIYISETSDYSFSGIYNVTEVWGQVLELEMSDRYADSSTLAGDTYSITLEDADTLDEIDHLDRIGIKICADSPASPKVSINGQEAIPVVDDAGNPLAEGRMRADTTYVFTYRRNLGDSIQNCLYLLGQYQAYGIYKEMNPDCPYSVPSLGYEIVKRVNYDNLYSDDLCYNQAEYLTYQTTAMLDTIQLTCILIPWLDVNEKVRYTSRETGETAQYMVRDFSWSTFDGTMTVTLYRFLESFSYVKQREEEAQTMRRSMKL